MGLAVIVILLTLGSLFVIQFVVLNPPQEIKKTFTQTQTAANTLTALLRTSTGCKETTVMDLLQNCAEHSADDISNRICCPETGTTPDCDTDADSANDGYSSCTKASTLITSILERSLKGYGIQNYEFRVINSRYYQPLDPLRSGECLTSKESKQAYFQTATGIVTIYLDVC